MLAGRFTAFWVGDLRFLGVGYSKGPCAQIGSFKGSIRV